VRARLEKRDRDPGDRRNDSQSDDESAGIRPDPPQRVVRRHAADRSPSSVRCRCSPKSVNQHPASHTPPEELKSAGKNAERGSAAPTQGDGDEVSPVSERRANSQHTGFVGRRTGSYAGDGLRCKYVGTVAELGGGHAGNCGPLASVDMTITGGQVVIHEILFTGGRPTFRGNVNAAGEVTTTRYLKAPPTDIGVTVDTIYGVIHNKVFVGEHRHGYWCYWSIRMAAAPAPGSTTPFDGWYRGVSREVLDGSNSEHSCDARALTPPAPLKITNGVVGIPGVPS